MAPKLLRVALITCLLITLISASRFTDIAKRKGYGPNAKKRASSNSGGEPSNTKFQFLTKATQRLFSPNQSVTESQLLNQISLPSYFSPRGSL